VIARRIPDESNDSVNLVVSLLVRHPELSRVIIKPRLASIAFFFVVRSTVPPKERADFRRSIADHVRALHALARVNGAKLAVRLTAGKELSFVEFERDTKTLTRDEIALIVALVAQSFGERLVVNPPADDVDEDDGGGREDVVGSALDAVRSGHQRKGLVGFREERRVLVYFGKA